MNRAAVALACVACGGGADEPRSTVVGRAYLDGLPQEGVIVTAGDENGVSDADGRFEMSIPAEGPAVLAATAAGLAPAWLVVEARGLAHVFPSVTLRSPDVTPVVDAVGGDDVAHDRGVLTIPAGSLVTEQGDPVTGSVRVAITVHPDAAWRSPPIPLDRTDGAPGARLAPFGIVHIAIERDGVPCDVAPGAALRLTYAGPAPGVTVADLYAGDPATARWMRDATGAVHDGTTWEIAIRRLGWWAIATSYEVPVEQRTCLELRVLRPDDAPLSGISAIASWGAGDAHAAYGFTGLDGTFCFDAYPPDTMITVTYGGVLDPAAIDVVAGQATTTTAAAGTLCGVDCPHVDVVLACLRDEQCAPGVACIDGVCAD